MKPLPVVLALGALATLPARAATAQEAPWLVLSAGVRASDLRTGPPGAEDQTTGTTLGSALRLRLWRVSLEAAYEQGHLGTGTSGLDLVEGAATLGIAPVRWLRLDVGPQIRALVREGGTERWVVWNGQVSASWHLAGETITSFADAWRALGATVNSSSASGEGLGIRGGVLVRPPGLPVGLRAGYDVSRLRLTDGSRRETLQRFFLDVVLELR